MNAHADQLGFDALLRACEADNQARKFERATAHLPSVMEDALPYYRVLLRSHHAAMLAGNVDETMRLRREAHDLAYRLNGGEAGILAGPDAPGCVLARKSAAADGAVPLWGQCGVFEIDVCGMRVRIAQHGVFGIAASSCYWPGFAAHAVTHDRPFLSETGYRSFIGVGADPEAGLLPDECAAKVITAYVARALKGRLVAIAPEYRRTCA